MAERRINKSLQLIVVLIASLLALTAEAIQLGELSGHSLIGQPLDATVGVWLTTRDKSQPLRFKLSPDIAYRSNAKMSATVARMSVELAKTVNGRHYIQLRSDVAIDEPVLAFRLKIYVGDNAIMRNYSLALNPPPTVRTRDSKRNVRSGRSSVPISQSDYTVVAGDTLWAIARRVSLTTGANVGELVEQIFNDNPQAFIAGNENRLIRGTALRLPIAATTLAATTPKALPSTPAVTAPESPYVAGMEITNEPVVTNESQSPIDTPTPLVAAAEATRATAREPVDWRLHEPELAAQLEALRLKYIAIKAQYDIQHEAAGPVTTVEPPAPAESALPAPVQSPTVALAAPDVSEQLQSEPPVSASPEAGAAESLASEGTRMAVDNGSIASLLSAPLVVLLFGALAFIALLVIGARKVHAGRHERKAEIAHHEKEADFKAEVARKAANRVQMESEVQRMLASREGEPGTPEVSTPVSSVATVQAVAGNDAEIDHNIAHGRYGEAEKQLHEVISASPRNFSAKLRLLEVYYMTEDVDPFCELADDLHVNHRADLTDDEWRRVIRMGKMTAPDRMPFSGPRGLDNSDEAS